jgi:hypothetical protein
MRDIQVHKSLPHNSEEQDPLQLLRTAIGSGDWELARSAAERLASTAAPDSADGLKAQVDVLIELLNVARAKRAHLADSLTRVTAAQRFQGTAILQGDDRQNLVDSTEF